jgi:hypothetical protein
MSVETQIALITAGTTLGTAILTAVQTIVLEWMRRRKADAARKQLVEDLSERVNGGAHSKNGRSP